MKLQAPILCVSIIALVAAAATSAQEIERTQKPQRSPAELQIRAPRVNFTCRTGKCVETYTGDVEVRVGDYFLQADKVSLYKSEGRVVAEGNVVFFQSAQRTTGSRLEWDYQQGRIISLDTSGFKGRRAKHGSAGSTKLEEAIKRAYELPGELLRRDAEDFNRMQTESSFTQQPPIKGKPR